MAKQSGSKIKIMNVCFTNLSKTCVKSALEKYGRNYFYKETSIGVTTSCYSLIKHLISKVYTWQKKKNATVQRLFIMYRTEGNFEI